MAWKMGQQIKVATPEGGVYVASNRVHNHSTSGYVMYTIDSNGRLVPFVVGEDLMNAEEKFSESLDQVVGLLTAPQ